jgi:hypothetical protein
MSNRQSPRLQKCDEKRNSMRWQLQEALHIMWFMLEINQTVGGIVWVDRDRASKEQGLNLVQVKVECWQKLFLSTCKQVLKCVWSWWKLRISGKSTIKSHVRTNEILICFPFYCFLCQYVSHSFMEGGLLNKKHYFFVLSITFLLLSCWMRLRQLDA